MLACRNASRSYRRGLADMLAIAKEHAYVLGVGARISWSDVDAEAAKRMEGVMSHRNRVRCLTCNETIESAPTRLPDMPMRRGVRRWRDRL